MIHIFALLGHSELRYKGAGSILVLVMNIFMRFVIISIDVAEITAYEGEELQDPVATKVGKFEQMAPY